MGQNFGAASSPFGVVEMAVLGPYVVAIFLVSVRIGTEHREVGIEHDRHVGVLCCEVPVGAFDHGAHAADPFVRPAELGQVFCSESGARSLVGRVLRLVHRIVVEHRGNDGAQIVDRFGLSQFDGHSGDGNNVIEAVVTPMPFAVPPQQLFEQSIAGGAGVGRVDIGGPQLAGSLHIGIYV